MGEDKTDLRSGTLWSMRTGSDREPLPSDPGETPEAFLAAIHSALEGYRIAEARQLAKRAASRFPQNPQKQDIHQEQRVPRSDWGRRGPVEECVCQIPTHEWLERNSERYRGRWVAVLYGELVADAEEYGELCRKVEEKNPCFLPLYRFFDPWEGRDPDPPQVKPHYFLSMVQASLNAGSPRGAQYWTEKGLSYFPDHEELMRLQWFLRPGKARVVTEELLQKEERTREWLEQNADRYKGRWIAVLDGDLMAASEKFGEVLRTIRERGLEDERILVRHFE
jgi:hypothetical protein